MELTHIYERRVDPDGHDSLAKLSRLVRPESLVLELGPATGYFTRHLVEELGCTVDCVEYAEEAARRAAKWARTMWVADLDAVDLSERFEAGTYDSIVAADVLEHLRDPWRVARACRELLKPDGRLLLSIPNVGHAALVSSLIDGRFDYTEEGLLDRTHLRFFTRKSLLEMLRETGYRVESLGAVVVMADNTEMRRSLEQLTPALREQLLRHPDSLTYQFIVDAAPGEMTDDEWTELELEGTTPPVSFTTTLFWAREGDGFAADRSVTQSLPIGPERQRLRIDLPAGARFSALRFDPADRPGYLKIFSLAIVRGRGAERVWSADRPEEIPRRARIAKLGFAHSALGDTFLATAPDPEIVVELGREVEVSGDDPWALEAELAWPMSADYVLLNQTFAAELERARIERDLLEADRVKQAERIRELLIEANRPREAEIKLHVLEGRYAEIQAEYVNAQAELRKIDRELARFEDEYALMGSRVREVHRGYAGLEAEYARAEGELEQLRSEVEALALERDRLAERLEDAKLRVADTRRELRERDAGAERAWGATVESALAEVHATFASEIARLRDRERVAREALARTAEYRLKRRLGRLAPDEDALPSRVEASVDAPVPHALVAGPELVVSGWVVAPGDGIVGVRVRLGDGEWVDSHFGLERPDVAAMFPSVDSAGRSGFTALVPTGPASIGARACHVEVVLASGAREQIEAPTVFVVRPPAAAAGVTGSLDSPAENETVAGDHVAAGGWVVGESGDPVVAVRARVGAGEWMALETGIHRPDILEVLGRAEGSDRAGFAGLVPAGRAASGWQPIEVEVEYGSGARRSLGRRFVEIVRPAPAPPPKPVLGSLDGPPAGALGDGDHVAAGGWALAVGDDRVVAVRARVGGGAWQELEYGKAREDLVAVFPDDPGAATAGFSGLVSLDLVREGRHTIEVEAELASGARHSFASRAVYVLPIKPVTRGEEAGQPPRRRAGRAVLGTGVDIIVPIFNAREDVKRCVESVLRHARGDWRLVLVDDASTDEELVLWLDDVAERESRVLLERGDRNLGFTANANRGMRIASGRDVILLNSDTIVTEGFVEKLMACAYAERETGVVSPFTNNGTICSIPEFCRDNPLPEELSLEDYAALVERVSLRDYPELVTAVGFCMYVKGEVFDTVGYFDDEAYGRGYGEENDFCERAKAAGYRIRLADDTFIAHTGKASFGDEGRELEVANQAILEERQPQYMPAVREFVASNPLAKHQANIAYHMRRRDRRDYPALAFLLHRGVFGDVMGGTEHHVRDLVSSLAAPRAVIVFPHGPDIVAAEVLDGDLDGALMHHFPREAKFEVLEQRSVGTELQLARIVSWFGVGAAHIHHLINWPLRAWRVFEARRIPFVYTAHDYYCACPSWNLLDREASARCECSGASEAERARCLLAKFEEVGVEAPSDPLAYWREHRAEFGTMLERAEAVIAPSQAARAVVASQHAGRAIQVEVVEHGYEAPEARSPGTAADERLRVALLGAVAAPWKGSERYLDLVKRLAGEPVEWHVFGVVDALGYLERLEEAAPEGRLVVHGEYRREEAPRLLASNRVDVALLLSPWDETFCYTLSEAWLGGVPAIVSDAGAPADRVRATGAGIVVGSDDEAAAVLARFAGDRSELALLRERAASAPHVALAENARRHRDAYGRIWEVVTSERETTSLWAADAELFEAYWRAR